MKKMNKKGFTLVELLAVIAILAILILNIIAKVSFITPRSKISGDERPNSCP